MKKYFLTLLFIGAFLSFLELNLRIHENKKYKMSTLKELVSFLKLSPPETKRENENRYIAQNILHFEKLKSENIEPSVAFFGSSRTKVLSPHHFFNKNFIVVGSNSYNDITWGLLLEAEAQRQLFPQLKTFWFEASFLLRRPDYFHVEPDHKKYIFLLKEIIKKSPELQQIAPQIKETSIVLNSDILLFKMRSNFRFYKLFTKGTTYDQNPQMNLLSLYGEQKNESAPGADHVTILDSNEKIIRIKEAANNIPGDNLFDAIALWAKMNQLKIGFYIPPVRQELYEKKQELHIAQHLEDVVKMASKYQVPLVNFMTPQLNWMSSVSLYGDEDHLSTCRGSYSMTNALVQAVESPQDFTLQNVEAYLPTKSICP